MFEIVGVIAVVLIVLVLVVQQRGTGAPAANGAAEERADGSLPAPAQAVVVGAPSFADAVELPPTAMARTVPPSFAGAAAGGDGAERSPPPRVVMASPGVPLAEPPAAPARPPAGRGARAPSGFDYGGALAEANPQVVGMVAPAAIAQYPTDLSGLREGLASGDAARVAALARALNGTLGLFKARPALAAVRRIEQLVREGRCEEALVELDRLEPEIAALSDALARAGG
ncbi:MAG: hypothetical protein JNM90_13475 [Burkholderiales bacterium]|nr:hypothetical protein [Burkholderiales bacterium]